MKHKLILTVFMLIVLPSCSSVLSNRPGQAIDTLAPEKSPSRELEASTAVQAFYNHLSQGNYEQAKSLYGGAYDVLQGFNPNLDPDDHAALLETGCQSNGLMCLRVLALTSTQAEEPLEFVFEAAFANPDGSQFVLGPCCGATETDMPPVSVFEVHVTCVQGGPCLVFDLPPYVP